MADETLTFRLSISDPRATDMAGIARALEQKGFAIEPDGRSGFLLTASRQIVETTFNTTVEMRGQQYYFSELPNENKILKDVSFRVYFPTKPEFFR